VQIVDNKLLIIRTRNPSKFAVIPHSKLLGPVNGNGVHEVSVDWQLDEARVLKNLGVRNVPSPIMRDYNWPGRFKPFTHQKETAAFLTMNRRAFVFSEAGTAKTVSALWAADYLMTRGEIHRVLIVCPLSIMTSVWIGDINNTIVHRNAVVAHHTIAERRITLIQGGYEFVIINYDGLALVADTIRKDGRFDLIIADECNYVKTSSTKRWKILNSLLTPRTQLWMMTGTPAAQSPVDAYGLAKLVNPAGVPPYYGGWRDKVMYKVNLFKWAPKSNAYEQVHTALQPAIRYSKAECLDLPPVLTEIRDVPLTVQQRKYYKLLKTQLILQASGETITAVNAAAAVNKLLQISAGAAYSDTRETVEFDCSPRMQVLQEIIEETSRKVLVFAPYRHSIESIRLALSAIMEVECIHGDVSPHRRTAIFSRFQTDPSLRVLIIQPQAASHGVTLTAADTVVFWGPVMSVETYIQCIARTDRVGQNSDKVTVVHLQGSDIERRMFKQLANKVDSHTMLLDIYEQEVLDRSKGKKVK